jgi:hypothetical protein
VLTRHAPAARRKATTRRGRQVARRAALLECMEVAYTHYRFAWAKTAIDMLFRAAVDRRQLFADAQAARTRTRVRSRARARSRSRTHARARA